MSELIDKAVRDLNARLGGRFDGSARFDIAGEGSIVMDEAGARPGDTGMDVAMAADAGTFRDILDGTLDPAAAFMSGRLSVDGDMAQAMKLAAALG